MSERDHLYDRKRLLVEASRAEADPFKGTRRLGALAAALTGTIAGGAELGCVDDDELGAYGGSPDIPPGLVQMQQWAGGLLETTPTRPGRNMVRISLPENYARDWTVQLGAPGVPSGASVGVASTQAAEVQMRWGHHGAQETVVMDYPARGASFTVHGSYVEVSVFDPGTPVGTPTATYQVWVNEGASARSSPDAFQPVRSERFGTLAGVGAANFIAPPRARAFYLTFRPSPGLLAAQEMFVATTDNGAVLAEFRVTYGFPSPNLPNASDMMSEPWFLPPDCNVVSVAHVNPDPIDALTIHWLLDLGS